MEIQRVYLCAAAVMTDLAHKKKVAAKEILLAPYGFAWLKAEKKSKTLAMHSIRQCFCVFLCGNHTIFNAAVLGTASLTPLLVTSDNNNYKNQFNIC